MCPACIASLALVAGSAISASGMTALVLKKFSAKNVAKKIPTQSQSKENYDGH
jgi:hypothetical protein